jgi:hypothetical protein
MIQTNLVVVILDYNKIYKVISNKFIDYFSITLILILINLSMTNK